LDPRRVFQKRIHQVLDAAVVEEIVAHDRIVLVFHAYNEIRIIRRVRICQRADVLEEFPFAFLCMQVQLPLLIVKTRLVVMREQVFDEEPFVDHFFWRCLWPGYRCNLLSGGPSAAEARQTKGFPLYP
jgi:hypothetical protein